MCGHVISSETSDSKTLAFEERCQLNDMNGEQGASSNCIRLEIKGSHKFSLTDKAADHIPNEYLPVDCGMSSGK